MGTATVFLLLLFLQSDIRGQKAGRGRQEGHNQQSTPRASFPWCPHTLCFHQCGRNLIPALTQIATEHNPSLTEQQASVFTNPGPKDSDTCSSSLQQDATPPWSGVYNLETLQADRTDGGTLSSRTHLPVPIAIVPRHQ